MLRILGKSISLVIFILVFILGCKLRMANAGWLMFVLLIPELIFRLGYLIGGTVVVLFGRNLLLLIAIQISYLLTSFCTYDGGDINAYAFAGLWINPSTSWVNLIFFCYAIFIVLTVILLAMSLLKIFREYQKVSVRA